MRNGNQRRDCPSIAIRIAAAAPVRREFLGLGNAPHGSANQGGAASALIAVGLLCITGNSMYEAFSPA
jgi:hypothetical protein